MRLLFIVIGLFLNLNAFSNECPIYDTSKIKKYVNVLSDESFKEEADSISREISFELERIINSRIVNAVIDELRISGRVIAIVTSDGEILEKPMLKAKDMALTPEQFAIRLRDSLTANNNNIQVAVQAALKIDRNGIFYGGSRNGSYTLEDYDHCRDFDGQYEGKYGIWN